MECENCKAEMQDVGHYLQSAIPTCCEMYPVPHNIRVSWCSQCGTICQTASFSTLPTWWKSPIPASYTKYNALIEIKPIDEKMRHRRYKNNKTGHMYTVLCISMEATNTREGCAVVNYTDSGGICVFSRVLDEFEQKFTLVSFD